MTLRRHEIPTHLNVEDRAFYGLSARQAMHLIVGVSASYGLWNQWLDLAVGLRLALAVGCLAFATALALLRPHGRGLEEWVFVILRYAARPKAAVWHPREPAPNHPQPSAARWEDLEPRLSWKEDVR